MLRRIQLHDLGLHGFDRGKARRLVAPERTRGGPAGAPVAEGAGTLRLASALTELIDQGRRRDQRPRHRDEVAFLLVQRALDRGAGLESAICDYRKADLLAEARGIVAVDPFDVAPADVEQGPADDIGDQVQERRATGTLAAEV